MASAYSILRNYGDYIQPYDLGLVQQGLQYKQGKYDVNRLKVDQQIEQFANLDLIKGVDKQYLNDRLSELVNQVNQYGTMDLSENGITKNIGNHIKQALDTTVMNAYVSSNEIRKTFSTIEDVKKNHPDKYAVQNEYDAMEGVNEYLSNSEVGASYKSKGYTPFTDINKILDDRVKNADKYLTNITKVTTANGDYFVDQYNEAVDPNKIRNLVRSTLTPQLQNQVLIDAKFNMRGLDDTSIRAVAKEDYSNQITSLNGIKKLAESDLIGIDKKDPKYQQYKNYIGSLDGQINDYNGKITDLDKTDTNSLKYNLYYNQLENNYVGLYSGVLRSEQTLRENSIPIRYKEFYEKQRQADIDNQFQAANLDLANQRLGLDKDKFGLDVAMKDYQMKKDGYDSASGTFKGGVDAMGNPIAKAGAVNEQKPNEQRFTEQFSAARLDYKNALFNSGNNDVQKLDDKTFFGIYGVQKSEFKPENMDKIMSIFQSKMSGNPDSKLVPINNNLRQKFDKFNHFNKTNELKNTDIEQTISTTANDIIYGFYNNSENKARTNMQVPEFTIAKTPKGGDEIQYTGRYVSWGQMYGNKEADLNRKIGNTGKTYRDMAQVSVLTGLISRERGKGTGAGWSSLIQEGDEKFVEQMSNYINKVVGGGMTQKKVEDSQSFWGSMWENVAGNAGIAKNKVDIGIAKLFGQGTSYDEAELKQYENRAKKATFDSQIGHFLDDSANDSRNVKEIVVNGRATKYNPVKHVMELSGANKFNWGTPLDFIVELPDKEDSSMKYIDARDLSPTNRGTGIESSIDDRFRTNREILNKRVDKYNEAALGMYPQDFAYSIDPKSQTGKTLSNIVNGKASLEGESGSVVGSNIVYERNEQGGLNVTVDFGTAKSNEKKTIVLSPDEVPTGLSNLLNKPSYNPAYDARLNSASSIDYSSSLFRSNQEKLNYSKNNGTPLNQLYGEDDFYRDLNNTLPPQYKQQFEDKYSKALNYLVDNKSTFSLVPSGDGYFAKQWKVGDVIVGLEPTSIQTLMDEDVSSIYKNGQSTMMQSFKQIISDFGNKGYSSQLDEINNYLKQTNAR